MVDIMLVLIGMTLEANEDISWNIIKNLTIKKWLRKLRYIHVCVCVCVCVCMCVSGTMVNVHREVQLNLELTSVIKC